MHLKRLECVGFKSFATRTVAELPAGIVAVVGPNGSGKSNIADAVRWVLGEQSARAVRARKPEEVIFAGSAGRAPLGLAEVSLVLDNEDGTLRDVPFSEVRVTRRLYRGGDSEYLLNNSRVRLRDLSQYLLQAGLGPDSYCVIGQGSVDELILQRPDERRVALENAADVRRYQLRLAELRSRLSTTEANLTRVQDVLAELGPHLRRLKGQADRARRARGQRTELHRLLRQYLGAALAEANAAVRDAAGELAAAEQAVAAVDAERQQLHAEGEGAVDALARLEERLAAERSRLAELQREQARLERDALAHRERAGAAAREHATALASSKLWQDRAAALRVELAEHDGGAAPEPSATPAAADSLRAARSRVEQSRTGVEERRRELEAARARRTAAESAVARAEAALQRATAARQAAVAARAAAEARAHEREAALASTRAALAEQETALAAARNRLDAALAAQQSAQQALRTAEEAARAAEARERAARQQVDRLVGALAGMGVADASETARLPEGWQAALADVEVLGTAGDLAARVRAVDRLLRGFLGRVVVVADDAAARIAFERLAEAQRGENAAWAVLSASGRLLSPGGEQPLAPADEGAALVDWQRAVAEHERRLAAARAELAEAAQAALTHGRALEAARGPAHQAAAEVPQARSVVQRLERDLAGTRQALARLEPGAREVPAPAADGEAAEAAARAALQQARAEREAAAAAVSAAEQAAQAEMEAQAAARAALADEETAVARDRAAREARAQLVARIRRDLARAEEAQAAEVARTASAERDAAALAATADQLDASARAAAVRAAEAAQAAAELEAERAAAQSRLVQQRALQEALQARERAARSAHEQALVASQRARDALERVRAEETQAIEDGLELGGAGDGWAVQPRLSAGEETGRVEALTPDEMAALRARIASLRRELRATGDAPEGVLEEYEAMTERQSFLEGQSGDLRQAMEELRSAAAEMEAYIAGQFADRFHAVNDAFQACFQTLFGGGEARLVLTDPASPLTTGVEVVARPPGKRLQPLLALSGGERALTVVALLFGLLRVSPTPFCILDEVDAALDEANVQRFANLLTDFARAIQFIVVTHNRATMQAAGALYGVTMDAQGVSHLLSARPRAVAAEASGAAAPIAPGS